MPFETEYVKTLLVSVFVGAALILCASSNVYTYFEYDTTVGQISNIQAVKNKGSQLSINYTVNGIQYNETLQDSSPGYKVGDTISIDYNKNNVTDIRVSANHLKSGLSSLVAGIICLFIFYFTFIRIKRDVEKTVKLFK